MAIGCEKRHYGSEEGVTSGGDMIPQLQKYYSERLNNDCPIEWQPPMPMQIYLFKCDKNLFIYIIIYIDHK